MFSKIPDSLIINLGVLDLMNLSFGKRILINEIGVGYKIDSIFNIELS